MTERLRRAPKSAAEWQSLMNRVIPELIKLADANGDFEGPLTPETERIIGEAGLDCNATGLIDRLKAIGWIEDYGRVSGQTRKYHFRRDAVPLDKASRAEYMLKKERARLNADAAARRTADKASGPAPEVTRRVDKDQLVPGKQVMVTGPAVTGRPKLKVPGKPADMVVTRPHGRSLDLLRSQVAGLLRRLSEPRGSAMDDWLMAVLPLTGYDSGNPPTRSDLLVTAANMLMTDQAPSSSELEAAHRDIEGMKTQLKEIGEDRDRARELAVELRGRLVKADTLIDTILSGDPQTVQVIRTAIEYDRRHGADGT